jgi:hypothetical protein
VFRDASIPRAANTVLVLMVAYDAEPGFCAAHRGTGRQMMPLKTAAQSTPAFAPSCSRYPAVILQSAEVGVTKRDSKSVAYENRTKSAKCGGLETNGPRERISGPDGLNAVRRFSREARGYWRFQRGKSRRRKLVSEGLAEREGFEVVGQRVEAYGLFLPSEDSTDTFTATPITK